LDSDVVEPTSATHSSLQNEKEIKSLDKLAQRLEGASDSQYTGKPGIIHHMDMLHNGIVL
jgi:6-phosphogluconate dehydrogenase